MPIVQYEIAYSRTIDVEVTDEELQALRDNSAGAYDIQQTVVDRAIEAMNDELRNAIHLHRSLPITERDLKALNERVTELRRKMPDDEPATILIRLQQNGEFLWADEAHIEGALARIDDIAQWNCVNNEDPSA